MSSIGIEPLYYNTFKYVIDCQLQFSISEIMLTKEWLEQHTKVQAYLDADLSAKLTTWMKEKNISQFLQAVVAILEHYLNDRLPSKISSQVLFALIGSGEERSSHHQSFSCRNGC